MLIGSCRPGTCAPVLVLLRVAMPMLLRPTAVTPSICLSSRISVSVTGNISRRPMFSTCSRPSRL
jgi:hypothetical protein